MCSEWSKGKSVKISTRLCFLAVGTEAERGIAVFNGDMEGDTKANGVAGTPSSGSEHSTYDLPYITPFLRRCALSRYIPVSPTYQGCPLACKSRTCSCCRRGAEGSHTSIEVSRCPEESLPLSVDEAV